MSGKTHRASLPQTSGGIPGGHPPTSMSQDAPSPPHKDALHTPAAPAPPGWAPPLHPDPHGSGCPAPASDLTLWQDAYLVVHRHSPIGRGLSHCPLVQLSSRPRILDASPHAPNSKPHRLPARSSCHTGGRQRGGNVSHPVSILLGPIKPLRLGRDQGICTTGQAPLQVHLRVPVRPRLSVPA